MKIAIFHNYMDNIGGAEIVSLTLARELGADIYTTLIDEERISSLGFADILPRIRSIGTIPKQAPFKQQAASWLFRKLDLPKQYPGQYNFYIICGDWAMSAAVHNKPNLWYVHGPLNELWEFRDMVREKMMDWWKHPIFDSWVWFNRKLTLSYARHVELWACNSENSRGRIRKYYDVDATVIYPPIDTMKYRNNGTGNYWLAVNRLLNHKRVEIQLDAFAKMPDQKLIIVGSYEKNIKHFEAYRALIEQRTPPNVFFKHWVDHAGLIRLYADCRGFITTSENEDFGMTAVEAMASGKPVIAPNEGGYRESVVDGETGVLIDDIDPEKLAMEIARLSKRLDDPKTAEKYRVQCEERAARFDTSMFMTNIKYLIKKGVAQRRLNDIESVRKALVKAYTAQPYLGILSFYLWGSVTRDDYVPNKSDVDVIAITDKSLSEKKQGGISRIARAAAPWIKKLNISYFTIDEFMSRGERSKMSDIIPPEMLLTYFDTWQYAAGRAFRLEEFAVTPYTDAEVIGRHRSKALQDLLPSESPSIEKTDYAVKACMIVCHYLNHAAGGPHQYDPKQLLENATSETRDIIPTLLSLREYPGDAEKLRAVKAFLMSIRTSYPNRHLTAFFEEVLPSFDERRIPYWVVGGVAIAGTVGMFVRENKDIDVCVREEDLGSAHKLLEDICARHKESWKLVSLFDEPTRKTKVKIYVDGVERFSVDTIRETDDGVELVLLGKRVVIPSGKLLREKRVVDGRGFFTPQKSLVTDVLRYILDYYIDDVPLRLLEERSNESRYWMDAAALLDSREFDALYEAARMAGQKSFPRLDAWVGMVGASIGRISPRGHALLRSQLKRFFFWSSHRDTRR